MALARRPLSNPRTYAIAIRSFHATHSPHASVLFALSGLSNSRETQHFNKISRLNRIEHSPPLKLIKSSEVDAFPLPTPPPPRKVASLNAFGHSGRSAAKVWDERALRLGRAVLSDNVRQTSKLKKALQRARERETRLQASIKSDKRLWTEETHKLRGELRTAVVLILVSIGVTTALATWRFWPRRDAVDSTRFGERMAERTRAAMGFPTAREHTNPIPTTAGLAVLPTEYSSSASTSSQPLGLGTSASQNGGPWWKGLFWKQ